ncbi:MAG TPA: NAD(P)H-hydrate dehydratase [Pyrinomonadaceae bacterium]|nr:NAD(P)H-hydrate dehydratase [Pyrinomonadaceae bacterium]
MRKVVSAAAMREIDRLTTERYATPSLLLMEAAANASARVIASRFSHDVSGLRVLILCGRGNNGGDGAALARALWMKGALVDVSLFGRVEDARGDARTNFEIAQQLTSAAPDASATSRPFSFNECTSEGAWRAFQAGRQSYDVLVDALFGTGLRRPLESIYTSVVAHLAQIRATRPEGKNARPLVVSLDLPSGLNADAAEPIGDAVQADLTVTFTAPKPANVLPPACFFNGDLIVAGIGSPDALVEEAADSQLFLSDTGDARAWLEATRYRPGSYKNTHGHALVIAGSRRMSGAAVLCGDAAMRAGAGLVTIATPSSALPAVAARVMPEVMTAELAETIQEPPAAGTQDEACERVLNDMALERALELAARADAVALGPGLTSGAHIRRLVRAVVEQRTAPVVVDADALNALAPWPSDLRGTSELPLILTPHPGEMRRLAGAKDAEPDSSADRVETARGFAVAHGVILVLKGARTLIAAPDGRVFVNPTGNAGTGTAGAGDTLTGIITAFVAQARGTLRDEADAFAATVAAVYVAGLASDLAAEASGMRAMVASDIGKYLGAAIRALDPAGERP